MYNLDMVCNNILLNVNFKLTNLAWIELFNQYAKKKKMLIDFYMIIIY